MTEKTIFMPGDLVTIRQELPDKPIMIVVKKESASNTLNGIRCRWFTINRELQEAVWNTKDLQKYETKID